MSGSADIAFWHSPSPLWQRPPRRELRRFPPHLRCPFGPPLAPRAPSATVGWSHVDTDLVWRFASVTVAYANPSPEPVCAAPRPGTPPPGRRPAWLHIVLVGSLCAVSTATGGQELEGYLPTGLPVLGTPANVTVLTRPRPDYDPPGVHAGSFVVQPLVAEGFGFDSNPSGAPGQAGSAFASTQAAVSVASDWARDGIGASVTVDDRRYLQKPNLSRTDDTVSLGGRYDVGAQDHLLLSATHADLHVEPTGIDALSNQRAVPFQVNSGTASYLFNLSRLSFEPFALLNDTTYSATRLGGGSSVSNSYLDNTMVTEGVTARYELSPLRRLVAVVRSAESSFSHTTPGVPRRDSVDVSVLGGIDYVADGLFRYRALVGYQIREYASAAIKSQNAPIVEADVIWTPSLLTTVEATANRKIVNSTDPLIPGYTDTAARLQVEHEYLRDVLLNAHTSVELAQYERDGGRQTLYGAGVGATWLLNHTQRVSATFDHTQSSSNTRANYRDESVLVKFTAGI